MTITDVPRETPPLPVAPRFDLVDEAWIPCLMIDGQVRELSLKGVLLDAHLIREVTDPSPLVTVALHRMLLAILHRNFGPKTLDAWADLWQQGSWDARQLTGYLEKWRHRFNLFDDQFPFYQAASLNFSYGRRVSTLLLQLGSENGATLFDHVTDAAPVVLSPGVAARYLVACHAFALGGLVSFEKGQDRNKVGSAYAGPLVKAAVCLVKGVNLFETLAMNLLRYDENKNEPFPFTGIDAPAWERDTVTEAADRVPAGYIDLLTWQSRRLRLEPVASVDGTVMVRSVVTMKGNQLPRNRWRREFETMLAFQMRLKAKDGEEPWPALAFRAERALWRDSLAIFESTLAGHDRPRTVAWVGELVGEGFIPSNQLIPIDVHGLLSDRASVAFWRQERLSLPSAFLKKDSALIEPLRKALELAESVGRLFTRDYGPYIDSTGKPGQRPHPFLVLASELLKTDDRAANPKAIKRIEEQLSPGTSYWSRLDVPFQEFLQDLAQNKSTHEGVERFGDVALLEWNTTLERTANSAFEDTTRALNESARTLKAVTLARRNLRGWLHDLLPRDEASARSPPTTNMATESSQPPTEGSNQ